jgi:VWFA-related protein
MSRVFFPFLICGALLLSASATAQTPPPVDSNTTIRATASEVLLDLVVRDKHGKLVKNLKPGDVEILEDGSRREILSFRFVNGRDPQRASESNRAAAQVAVAGPGKEPTKPLRAVNLVCIVFHNLDPAKRKWATDAAQDFLKNDLLPDTYVGVFSLDDSLSPLQSFTNDRQKLQAAAAGSFINRGGDATGLSDALLSANPNMALVQGSVDMTSHTASFDLVITGGEVSKSAVSGAEVSTDAGSDRQRGESVVERRQFGGIEGLRQTDQIFTLIKQLAKLPGRKTVLLISPGIVTTGDPERLESLVDKASEAGITFYAIDANGLSENSSSLASSNALGHVTAVSRTQSAQSGTAGEAAEKSRQGDYQIEAVRTSGTQAALRAIAESTGGFLIANTNDFKKPFTKLIEEMDAHYEAIYRPESKVDDGSFRKIEVKLAKPDLRVESRTGYFAMPDLKGAGSLAAFETIGLAVLNAQPRPHSFDFSSSVLQFGPAAAGSRNILSFELPAKNLTATPEPQLLRHRLHVALIALVKDSSGQVVDKFSQDIPYFIPDSNLPVMLATSIPFKHRIDLPPGRYTLEAAIIDREGHKASTASIPFVSAENKGVGLSSVLLVRGLDPVEGVPDPSDPLIYQGKHVVPDLTPTLGADAKPLIYFVVYPDKSLSETPKLQVEFFADAKPVAIQSVKLPAPDASGAVAMLLRGPTRPGDCELRISTIQGDGSAEQSLKYKVLAK